MSLNTYDKTTGKLIPAAGIPYETLNSKANNTVISPSSTAEATTTATKPHTAGDYFELNGAFVKAKTNISIGDTLVEGTNIESTNVGSELKNTKTNISSLTNSMTVTDPDEGSGLITFGVDNEGNYGYKKVGDNTITPFGEGAGGNVVLPVDPATEPTENGAIWITTN